MIKFEDIANTGDHADQPLWSKVFHSLLNTHMCFMETVVIAHGKKGWRQDTKQRLKTQLSKKWQMKSDLLRENKILVRWTMEKCALFWWNNINTFCMFSTVIWAVSNPHCLSGGCWWLVFTKLVRDNCCSGLRPACCWVRIATFRR